MKENIDDLIKENEKLTKNISFLKNKRPSLFNNPKGKGYTYKGINGKIVNKSKYDSDLEDWNRKYEKMKDDSDEIAQKIYHIQGQIFHEQKESSTENVASKKRLQERKKIIDNQKKNEKILEQKKADNRIEKIVGKYTDFPILWEKNISETSQVISLIDGKGKTFAQSTFNLQQIILKLNSLIGEFDGTLEPLNRNVKEQKKIDSIEAKLQELIKKGQTVLNAKSKFLKVVNDRLSKEEFIEPQENNENKEILNTRKKSLPKAIFGVLGSLPLNAIGIALKAPGVLGGVLGSVAKNFGVPGAEMAENVLGKIFSPVRGLSKLAHRGAKSLINLGGFNETGDSEEGGFETPKSLRTPILGKTGNAVSNLFGKTKSVLGFSGGETPKNKVITEDSEGIAENEDGSTNSVHVPQLKKTNELLEKMLKKMKFGGESSKDGKGFFGDLMSGLGGLFSNMAPMLMGVIRGLVSGLGGLVAGLATTLAPLILNPITGIIAGAIATALSFGVLVNTIKTVLGVEETKRTNNTDTNNYLIEHFKKKMGPNVDPKVVDEYSDLLKQKQDLVESGGKKSTSTISPFGITSLYAPQGKKYNNVSEIDERLKELGGGSNILNNSNITNSPVNQSTSNIDTTSSPIQNSTMVADPIGKINKIKDEQDNDDKKKFEDWKTFLTVDFLNALADKISPYLQAKSGQGGSLMPRLTSH